MIKFAIQTILLWVVWVYHFCKFCDAYHKKNIADEIYHGVFSLILFIAVT